MTGTTYFDPREKGLFKGLGAKVVRLPAALGEGVVDLIETGARMREVVRLRAMSDAELAVHGLTRDDIVGHVFHRRFDA